jgi:flagellar motility protein MotE (MotC chaperone)
MIMAVAGVTSLAGGFATGWLTRPKAALGSAGPASESPDSPAPPASPEAARLPAATGTPAADSGTAARTLAEHQLRELILEIREKIEAYDRKLLDLDQEKERLQMAQQTLKKDIETLNNLRVELATSVASLKTERDTILKTRTEIEQVEKTNLMAIAAAYDKMDPARAGEILQSMAQGQNAEGTSVRTANTDDAVKILHYMQDRTKAKVLAEMAALEPALAAALSQRLKQVTEKK